MKITLAICATAAVVVLAGCAYDYPTSTVAVATPAGPVVATSSVYYDQFYGPINTGYWGSDGMFHYRLAADSPWLIDRARHFRRDAANGFTVVTITPVGVPPA